MILLLHAVVARERQCQGLPAQDILRLGGDLAVHKKDTRSSAGRVRRVHSLVGPEAHRTHELLVNVRPIERVSVDRIADLGGKVEEVDGRRLHACLELAAQRLRKASEGDQTDAADRSQRLASLEKRVAEAAHVVLVPAFRNVGHETVIGEAEGEGLEVVAFAEDLADLPNERRVADPRCGEDVVLE